MDRGRFRTVRVPIQAFIRSKGGYENWRAPNRWKGDVLNFNLPTSKLVWRNPPLAIEVCEMP